MSSRDQVMWNADPLIDELSRKPKLDDDVVGVDWGNVGKQALGVNHLVGKTLLNTFGMGSVANQMEGLQNKGGALPAWATKTLTVKNPEYVVVAKTEGEPVAIKDVASVVVTSGKRFEGTGHTPGAPIGTTFSLGVDAPARVEVAQKIMTTGMTGATKKLTFTNVKLALFLGGEASGNLDTTDTPPPAAATGGGMLGGMGGMMGGGMKIAGTEVGSSDMGRDIDELLGYMTFDPLDDVGDDIGYSAGDIAANIFTGGIYGAVKAGTAKDAPDASAAFKIEAPDYKLSPAYLDAHLRLAEAQERAKTAKAKEAAVRARPSAVTPTISPMHVPEITLDLGSRSSNMSADMSVLGDLILSDVEEMDDLLGAADADDEILGAETYNTSAEKEMADAILRARGLRPRHHRAPRMPMRAATKHLPVINVLGSDDGGDDYTLGTEILGAPLPRGAKVPTRAPGVQRGAVKAGTKKMPAGGKFARGSVVTKRAPVSKAVSPHKVALKRTENAANRALRAGQQAQKRAALYKPAKHKTIVAGVEILGVEILGAAKKPLTYAQNEAIKKHTKAVAKTAAAVAKAKKRGASAVEAAKKAAAAHMKAKPVINKLMNPPKKTVMHGDDDYLNIIGDDGYTNIIGELDEMLGLNPGEEGYDERFDGPGTGDAPAGYTDPGAGDPTTMGSPSEYAEPDVQIPSRGGKLSKKDADTAWLNAPADAVIYAGQKGMPDMGFGSWEVFYGRRPDGALVTDHRGIKCGLGYLWDGERWGRKDYGSEFYDLSGSGSEKGAKDTWPLTGQASIDRGYGPLIGNPNSDLAGLQYALSENRWFWQSANAPKWATEESDKAIADLNAAKKKAADAAYAADAARIEQERAEMEETKAKQDAAIELAKSKSDAENAITQGKLDLQLQSVDIQAAAASTALDLQAEKLEQQAMQEELKYGVAEAGLEQKARQADLDYAIAHPEELAQAQAEEQQGGEEGYSEDTTDRGMFDGRSRGDVTNELYEEGRGEDYVEDEAAALAMDQE